MATAAQGEANRLNARKSTGPRSAEGKASSRFNAFKHGADARARIIPGEDEADLAALAEEYYCHCCPEGPVETRLVESLIAADWEQRRLARLEAAAIRALVARQENSDPSLVLGEAMLQDAASQNVLLKFFRRTEAARRHWFRAESELRKRQADRLSTPDNPPEAPQNEPNSEPDSEPDSGPEPPAPKNDASTSRPSALDQDVSPKSKNEANFTSKFHPAEPPYPLPQSGRHWTGAEPKSWRL